MPSGGARVPDRPAAVSGPGALSERTDGGPGQPIRVPAGGAYGERQAAVQQQQAAPLASGGPAIGGAPAAGGAAAPPRNIFGPTTMPNQPLTTGVPSTGALTAPDTKALLRMIYAKYPSPWIAAMLND